MTALDVSTVPRRPGVVPTPLRSLRQLLRADAVLTGLAGVLLLATAPDLADWAGLSTAGPVRVVGAFFALLAVSLAGISRMGDGLLLRVAPVNAVGDLLWAVASVVVAVAADLTGGARALIIVQAVFVFGVGEAKIVLARRGRASALS